MEIPFLNESNSLLAYILTAVDSLESGTEVRITSSEPTHELSSVHQMLAKDRALSVKQVGKVLVVKRK